MFLLFLQCGILTAPTVWYFNCPKQYGIFLLFLECGILTVPDNMEIPHYRGQLKYDTLGRVRTFHIVVDS
jgi:hypothetical protein